MSTCLAHQYLLPIGLLCLVVVHRRLTGWLPDHMLLETSRQSCMHQPDTFCSALISAHLDHTVVYRLSRYTFSLTDVFTFNF